MPGAVPEWSAPLKAAEPVALLRILKLQIERSAYEPENSICSSLHKTRMKCETREEQFIDRQGIVPTPYYDHEGITIYLGDCKDILPHLPVVDCLLTDPPYGVGLGKDNNQSKDSTHLGKRGYASYDDTYEHFTTLIVPRLNAAITASKRAVVFTGPNIHEQAKPVAMGGVWCPAAVGRTPWGSKNFLPVLFYGLPRHPGRHRPTVIRSTERAEKNGHPVPKPLGWITWAIELGSDVGELVLDPFMGSGTTVVAAKTLCRRAIGIEIDKRY